MFKWALIGIILYYFYRTSSFYKIKEKEKSTLLYNKKREEKNVTNIEKEGDYIEYEEVE